MNPHHNNNNNGYNQWSPFDNQMNNYQQYNGQNQYHQQWSYNHPNNSVGYQQPPSRPPFQARAPPPYGHIGAYNNNINNNRGWWLFE